MLLEAGQVYSNEQMAEWFQIKTPTFAKTKKKKLEYLKQFAIFEEVKGKVKILEVIDPEYVNPRDKANNNKLYQKDIAAVIKKQPLQMFKTCAGRVQMLPDGKTKKLNHKFATSYKYTRENLRAIAVDNNRVWCQRHYDEEVDFTPLKDEQLADWKEIISKYIGTSGQANMIASWKSQEDNGEIAEEEVMYNINNIISLGWQMAKDEFAKKYDFVPDSVAEWELTAWQNKRAD